MTWLAVWSLLREFWPHLVGGLLVLGIVSFALWVVGLVDQVDELEAANGELERQVELYRDNAVKLDAVRGQVMLCLDEVRRVQEEAERWQAQYDAVRRRPPRVVEVPVEVAAPGTPCDQAVAEIAVWIAGEVTDEPR